MHSSRRLPVWSPCLRDNLTVVGHWGLYGRHRWTPSLCFLGRILIRFFAYRKMKRAARFSCREMRHRHIDTSARFRFGALKLDSLLGERAYHGRPRSEERHRDRRAFLDTEAARATTGRSRISRWSSAQRSRRAAHPRDGRSGHRHAGAVARATGRAEFRRRDRGAHGAPRQRPARRSGARASRLASPASRPCRRPIRRPPPTNSSAR